MDMGVYWDATIDREADSEENRWLEELSLRETQGEGRARQQEYEELCERDEEYAREQMYLHEYIGQTEHP